MSYKVELTYFRSGGKCYTGGEYISEKKEMYEIFAEVRTLNANRQLPGLTEVHDPAYFITVNVPDHVNNHSALIFNKEEVVMRWMKEAHFV